MRITAANRSKAQDYIRLWSQPEPMGGCWLWLGWTSHYGYGGTGYAGEKLAAHRLSFRAFVGPTRGKYVCHKCDVPPCVNPDHLFLGTPKQNMRDMISKGRARFPSGERCWRSKLTWGLVREIRGRHTQGEGKKELAAAFGVSWSQIHGIVEGNYWREGS